MTDAMEARERQVINERIAREVFGLVECTAPGHAGVCDWPCYAKPESPDRGGELADYCGDIAAAWLVAEVLVSRGYSVGLDVNPVPEDCRDMRCAFRIWKNGNLIVAEYADTAPLAICKAALAALASPTPETGNG